MSYPSDPENSEPSIRPFLRYGRPPTPAGPTPGDHTTTLRPFVLTSGRVDGPDPSIGLETQVTVHPGAAPARLPPEQRAIVALCVEPLSVAEISARLRLHLGVTRIPDPDTIMRVIRGLRAIS
jgi:hypothetical protein